jgi:parallel beta-helix repeat protein
LNSSAATLTNNTIASNHGPLQLRGGGLCLWDSAVTLTNNTIADNERQGVYLLSSLPTPTITNSILWGNEWDLVGLASATYSDIGRGNTKGKGNISKDPRFVGGGDYHLQQSSPCINRGNNAAPGLPDTDIDGDPRILDGTVDMGADEATDEPPTYDISGTVTDAKGGQSLAKVQVKLYDAKGLVDTAVTGTDGQYEFTDLPAETYRLKFSLKGYQSVTIKDVVVPPDQVVDVELRKKKSQATIHWIVPPAAEMTVGESQTVRWQVTGEEVTSTALTCSSGGDPITQAIAITTGVEVAPGVYEAMINAVSPGRWYYTAAAEVDGETIAIKPIAVMVR